MKIYGTKICSTCAEILQKLTEKGEQERFVEVTGSVASFREFLSLRDTRPEFEEIKRAGRIGVPYCILEDGSILLDDEEIEKLL